MLLFFGKAMDPAAVAELHETLVAVKVDRLARNIKRGLAAGARAAPTPGRWVTRPMGPFSAIAAAMTGRRHKRNGPCPCGSGRKFKRCCLTK